MATLTLHAKQQIVGRERGYLANTGTRVKGIVSAAEVLRIVTGKESQISKLASSTVEVRVIVKRLKYSVVTEDGSNGDLVLACVDTRTMAVKTVMLQRTEQAKVKCKVVPYI
jgi:hypothetical protein